MPKQKITKLLAPAVPLKLQVEKVENALELRLAWTLRGVITAEAKLREFGVYSNVLASPGSFWVSIDAVRLAVGIWAMASQEHPEYADEAGFELITSYIVPENYGVAAKGLKEAFLESLSESAREEIRKTEAEFERKLAEAEAEGKPAPAPAADPTPAPDQA